MAKVFATLFQFPARVLQFVHVAIELFNVSLGLFGSQPLGFRARVFCLGTVALSTFSLSRSGADILEIFFVREVDDGDDRQRRQDGIEADGTLKLDKTAGNKSANEISQRRPKVMFGPRLPEWAIVL